MDTDINKLIISLVAECGFGGLWGLAVWERREGGSEEKSG